jgi:hypothetical protein
MRPFLGLNVPEPLDYDVFQAESSAPCSTDEQVLSEAAEMVGQARKLWDMVFKTGWSTALDENALLSDERCETGKLGVPAPATSIGGEWSKGIRNVIRTCIATSICVAALKKRINKSGKVEGIRATIPAPGQKDCWHPWWIVPVVSDS